MQACRKVASFRRLFLKVRMIHETPPAVARVLARHVPQRAKSILDPCVGNGALLLPVMGRVRRSLVRTVGIDIDKRSISRLRTSTPHVARSSAIFIEGDFLKLAAEPERQLGADGFDCIVMNPPFCARRGQEVPIRAEEDHKHVRKVPVEVAFVLNSLRLLNPKGRLLAVLPPSVICSTTTAWVRNYLFQNGSVLYVHELPRFSFSGIESRMYLFVYEKSSPRRSLVLLNHDLDKPEKIVLSKADISSELRLDFSSNNAQLTQRSIIAKNGNLEWVPVHLLAKIYRGSKDSPRGRATAIHTSDYVDGFWSISPRHRQYERKHKQIVRAGDLLVKRVGRDCASSLGRISGTKPVACTDCVMILRPNGRLSSTGLLFALRTVLTAEWGKRFVEKGTGASYLTASGLSELLVPTKLHKRFPRIYERYVAALRSRDFCQLRKLESLIQRTIEK